MRSHPEIEVPHAITSEFQDFMEEMLRRMFDDVGELEYAPVESESSCCSYEEMKRVMNDLALARPWGHDGTISPKSEGLPPSADLP